MGGLRSDPCDPLVMTLSLADTSKKKAKNMCRRIANGTALVIILQEVIHPFNRRKDANRQSSTKPAAEISAKESLD